MRCTAVEGKEDELFENDCYLILSYGNIHAYASGMRL